MMTKKLALHVCLAIILAAILTLPPAQPSLAQDGSGDGKTPPVEVVPDEALTMGAGSLGDEQISTFFQGAPVEFLAAEIDPSLAKTPFVIDYVPGGEWTSLFDINTHIPFWMVNPCQTFPEAAKAAVSYAANIWSAILIQPIPVPVHVEVCLVELTYPGQPLMISYVGVPHHVRNFLNAPFADTWYPPALANTLAGKDLDGASSTPEIAIMLNSRVLSNLHYETGPITQLDKYNLASIFLHDIGHGLGFNGSMWATKYPMVINGGWGVYHPDDGYDLPKMPLPYDRFTNDGQGRQLLNTTIFPNPSRALGEALISGDVYFNGPKAKAANSNQGVKLFSPDPFIDLLSYNHLDEIYNDTPNALMTSSLSKGETNYDPGPITKGVLADLGWTIASATPSAPTNILLSKNTVNENLPVGAVVSVLTAADPNLGDTFSFFIVPGTGSTDNVQFSISGNLLKTKAVLNYEEKSRRSIRVRATDQTGKSFEKVLLINVIDINEAPTDIILNKTSVAEVDHQILIGSLAAVDPDTGNTFSYSLVSGAGSINNALFMINDRYLYGGPLDYETSSSYAVRVRATDQSGLYFEKALTITVTDVNERPYSIHLSSNQVDENLASGTVIGTLSTGDEDVGDIHTYSLSCSGANNNQVSISGDQVVGGDSFDYEKLTVLQICVRSTDLGGLIFQQPFSIKVNNVNETATQVELYPNWIRPGSLAGSRVGYLVSDDPDIGDTLTYTLTPGFGDNDQFVIEGNQVKLISDLSKAEGETFTIQVELKDAAETGPAPQTIAITVLVPTVTYLPGLFK